MRTVQVLIEVDISPIKDYVNIMIIIIRSTIKSIVCHNIALNILEINFRLYH